MKRLVLFLAGCVLLFSAGITCYAKEGTGNNEKLRESFGIYATYVAGERNDYTAPVQDGGSEIELPDGPVIAVSGISKDALTLVIYPIPETDTDAWKWIQSCLSGKGSHPAPYEIYFLDKDDNCFLADGVTITITFPDSTKALSVFSLGTDGTMKSLDRQLKNGVITFIADGSRYYVLAQKEAEEVADIKKPQKEPDDTKNTDNQMKPDDNIRKTGILRTGDDSHCEFWSMMFCLGGSAAVCCMLLPFVREREKK